MTPMIDVVFLLIIFFLLSSHLARQEAQLPLPLPIAESGQRAIDQEARVVVNLRLDGTIIVSGNSVSADELQSYLQQRMGRVGQDLQLRVRSHREVPYQYVKPVLLAAARAGLWNVHFAVIRGTSAE